VIQAEAKIGKAMARLAEIRVYPVKSLAGGTRLTAEVEPIGLRGDRRWMVVTPTGQALTQREVPRMALVQASETPTGICLGAPGMAALHVAEPCGVPRPVIIWRQAVVATDAGAMAAAWLTHYLGQPCALVYLADPAARPADPEYSRAEDRVSFADGFPVLLTSAASLADLNARLAAPIPMLRFRPNLVIEGTAAWNEDHWHIVRIGSTRFRVVKPCDRCVITTIDPATAARPDPEEPLRTLKTFRRDARGRVLFGQNLIPDGAGIVTVGDEVTVERK
jgi:uncharacterized protein YcbX